MARPMELNYSVFGRIPHSDLDTEPSPTAHVCGTGFPELCYGDAPRISGVTSRVVHEKARDEASVSTAPVRSIHGM